MRCPGSGRVLAAMTFLRSAAAQLYNCQGLQQQQLIKLARFFKVLAGAVVTADHALRTREGWQRVRDTSE